MCNTDWFEIMPSWRSGKWDYILTLTIKVSHNSFFNTSCIFWVTCKTLAFEFLHEIGK